jgi:hypothetical protein
LHQQQQTRQLPTRQHLTMLLQLLQQARQQQIRQQQTRLQPRQQTWGLLLHLLTSDSRKRQQLSVLL